MALHAMGCIRVIWANGIVMSRRSDRAGLLVIMAGLLAPHVALSHAALIEAETAQAIRLHAVYDTGAPMSHAQVIIYAP